jgi:hypothetical protein
MQSSTMVVLRTLVMLGALVAVPLAALFGNSIWARLSKVVAVLQEDLDEESDSHDHASSGHDHNHDHTHAPQGASPRSAPIAQGRTTNDASPYPATQQPFHPPSNLARQSIALPSDAVSATGAFAPPSQMAPPASLTSPPITVSPAPLVTSETSPSAQAKATLTSPAFWPAESSTFSPPIAQVQAQGPAGSQDAPLAANQAAYIAPAESASLPPPPAYPDEVREGEPGQPSGAGNNFAQTPTSNPNQTAIERRLQSLGALHYRLETAGPQGELFRFQCKMGLEANPNYVGYFEATSSESLTAMKQVLEQVESWRAGAIRR